VVVAVVVIKNDVILKYTTIKIFDFMQEESERGMINPLELLRGGVCMLACTIQGFQVQKASYSTPCLLAAFEALYDLT
jgi:hypothetical protein